MKLVIVGMTLLLAGLISIAQAAPMGGQISVGSGSINQSGPKTTITQQSQNLAINWQSFDIATNEAVRFNQPNTSSVALNRILGSDPSRILGSLSANGQIFILNPNGVLFGNGAQVNVGGLVATDLSLNDADFVAGKYKFSKGGGASSSIGIINQGTLTAAKGGYIALLAARVSNQGIINASRGTALLAAGDRITLTLNNGSLLGYSIDEGVISALVENHQLIQADGGQVILTAKAADQLTTAVVNNDGIIEARTVENHNGTISLLSDIQSGQVNVTGVLDASAPSGGDGGFIETSAAHVKIGDSAKITTVAPRGKVGTWLIDPNDYTIGSGIGDDITGTALSNNLNNTSVTILSSQGATAGNGDIFVNDPVTWSANTTLTLTAARNVIANAVITATGNGATLAINAGGTVSVAIGGGLGGIGGTNGAGLSGSGSLCISSGGGSSSCASNYNVNSSGAVSINGGTINITGGISGGGVITGGTITVTNTPLTFIASIGSIVGSAYTGVLQGVSALDKNHTGYSSAPSFGAASLLSSGLPQYPNIDLVNGGVNVPDGSSINNL